MLGVAEQRRLTWSIRTTRQQPEELKEAVPPTASQPHLVCLDHQQHLAKRAAALAQHLVRGHGDDGGQTAVGVPRYWSEPSRLTRSRHAPRPERARLPPQSNTHSRAHEKMKGWM